MDASKSSRFALRSDRTVPHKRQLPRPKAGKHFLKGPIPLDWLGRAARLPGRSLHVAVLLWYAAGLQKTATVSLSSTLARRFGIERNAKYRALKWLEQAGLVSVANSTGQAPSVTLLDPDGAP